jgi:DNA-binding transcriptional regulator YiaG
MPNIGNILKQEISRLARREIKQQTTALYKAAAGYRRDIASLKRQVAALERTTKAQNKQLKKTTPVVAEPDTALRFRADGFKTLRKKLDLSAEQIAKLLGVSGQSIYAWETKRSTPRRAQLPAIAALRKMGKREATMRLAEMA